MYSIASITDRRNCWQVVAGRGKKKIVVVVVVMVVVVG